MNEMTLLEPQAQSLDELAALFREEHSAVGLHARRMLEHAFRAGEVLLRAKVLVPHGRWGDWLRANCEGSERSARVYMRLARHRAKIEANVQFSADLTIDCALRLLAPPQEEPQGHELANSGDVKDEKPDREVHVVEVASIAAELPSAADQPEVRVELSTKQAAEIASEIAFEEREAAYAQAQQAIFQEVRENAQAKIAAFVEMERKATERAKEWRRLVEVVDVAQAGPGED